MKFKIVNEITGDDVDIVKLLEDSAKRGKLFRLKEMFDDKLTDLKIITQEPHIAITIKEAEQILDSHNNGTLGYGIFKDLEKFVKTK